MKFLKVLAKVAVWVAVLCLLILLAVYLGQGYLVYPGRALYRGESPEWQARLANVAAQGYEAVQLDPAEGSTDDQALVIRGVWAKSPEAAAPAIIWLHDRNESLTEISHQLRPLRDLRVHVFAMEFRGFGQSAGTPSMEGILRDAERVYDYLRGEREDVIPDRIFAGGWGLGANLAMALAGTRSVAGVVAFEPLSSLPDALAEDIPFVPLRRVLTDTYDARAILSKGDCPVLVLHAGASPRSTAMARAVADAGGSRVRLHPVEGADAESLLSVAQRTGAFERVDGFFGDPWR